MTSENIYTPIKPTYLYIKQHSVTGVKYFGKTTQKDPYNYHGSGVGWTDHIKLYGTQYIETIWVSKLYYYRENIREFAIQFSIDNNIIESQIWANRTIETGIGGKA